MILNEIVKIFYDFDSNSMDFQWFRIKFNRFSMILYQIQWVFNDLVINSKKINDFELNPQNFYDFEWFSKMLHQIQQMFYDFLLNSIDFRRILNDFESISIDLKRFFKNFE